MDSLIDIDIFVNILKTNYHKLTELLKNKVNDDLVFTEIKNVLVPSLSKIVDVGEYNNTRELISDIMNITYTTILLKLDEMSIDEIGKVILGEKKYGVIKAASIEDSDEIELFDDNAPAKKENAKPKQNRAKTSQNK